MAALYISEKQTEKKAKAGIYEETDVCIKEFRQYLMFLTQLKTVS